MKPPGGSERGLPHATEHDTEPESAAATDAELDVVAHDDRRARDEVGLDHEHVELHLGVVGAAVASGERSLALVEPQRVRRMQPLIPGDADDVEDPRLPVDILERRVEVAALGLEQATLGREVADALAATQRIGVAVEVAREDPRRHHGDATAHADAVAVELRGAGPTTLLVQGHRMIAVVGGVCGRRDLGCGLGRRRLGNRRGARFRRLRRGGLERRRFLGGGFALGRHHRIARRVHRMGRRVDGGQHGHRHGQGKQGP
ncbi:MAG: hypothetical protein IPK74_07865 [Deltaproteobacteria bacterium]|nr:hypothetical protein [Deltaproteobacteria bacterium]